MRLYGARSNHHQQPTTYGTRTKIYRDGDDILIEVGIAPVQRIVPVAEVATLEGLLGWTYELTQKSWMDRYLLRQFLDVASEAGGVTFRTQARSIRSAHRPLQHEYSPAQSLCRQSVLVIRPLFVIKDGVRGCEVRRVWVQPRINVLRPDRNDAPVMSCGGYLWRRFIRDGGK
ncbi:hypothetical protein OKW28_008489 [Paraburkholderia sp. 40]